MRSRQMYEECGKVVYQSTVLFNVIVLQSRQVTYSNDVKGPFWWLGDRGLGGDYGSVHARSRLRGSRDALRDPLEEEP